jgi:hypothetical protein
MKRPNRQTIETDITDTILELRLPNTHARHQITGAAVVLWNTWKRKPDFEYGVQAVIQKYAVSETTARADAKRLLAYFEDSGLLE